MAKLLEATAGALLALQMAAGAATAQPLQILYAFDGADGAVPLGPLLQAADGALYGVTAEGGSAGAGTIFRMTTGGTFTLVYSFPGGAAGASPSGGLIQGRDGNFYGTTVSGGTAGAGTVFRMTAAGVVTNLHSFAGAPSEGAYPSGVIQATDGNLYGTTFFGGYDTSVDARGVGTLFRISLDGAFTQLLSYSASSANTPSGALAEGRDGRLYGNLMFGYRSPNSPGQRGTGSVYAIDLNGPGTVDVNFAGGPDGAWPSGALVQGTDGDFYGITAGIFGPFVPTSLATIFRMSPAGAITTLYAFGTPHGRWVMALDDVSLYITDDGGYLEPGTLSRLTSSGTLTLVHTFDGGSADGALPSGPVLQARDGNLYGVTMRGGPSNKGVVYRVALRITPGDLDGDVKADLPLYDASSGMWRIRTSAGAWTSSRTIALGGPGYTPVPADYDGDGRLDIAVYHAATGTWHVLTSSSGFTAPGYFASWGGIGYLPVAGDYDGDRKADVAVYRPVTGNWHILLSSAGFTTAQTTQEGGPDQVPVPGDYDGDHMSDVAVYAPATGAWHVRLSSSGYRTILTTMLGGLGYAPVPADFDGDGKSDIAVYDQAIGTWQVLKSAAATSTPWTIGWGGSGYTAVPGDYDGDGICDPAVYVAATGRWYVLPSASNYTTSVIVDGGDPHDIAVLSTPPRIAWTDALRASDFDGDGLSDLVAYEETTGEWRVLTSSSRFSTTQVKNWGGSGYTSVPGDYDGDGITDLAVYRADTGLWSVLTSTSGGTAMLSVPWGGPGYEPVPGDYDGDLRTDIAVYAPATSTWHLLLSSTGFTSARNVNWGTPGDRAAPADFDGDGLTDLGVYSPASGLWRVALGAHDYATAISMAWGGPDYTPAPRDFDGDGSADFAVWVPATGTWYMLLSGRAYASAMSASWGHAIVTSLAADYDADGIADPASYDTATGAWSVWLSTSVHTLALTRTLGGPGYVPLPR